MKIVCPQCAFGRDIPDDRLPGKAVVATCPRCKHRFRMCVDESSGVATVTAVATVTSVPSQGPAPASSSPAPAGEAPFGVTSPASHESNTGDDPLPPGAIVPRSEVDGYASPVTPQRAPEASPRRTEPTQFEADMEAQRRATEAYSRQSEASAEQEAIDDFALENPWENPRFGYPAAFYQTAMRVMFAAPRFFAGLEPLSSHVRPLLFCLVVSVLQTLIDYTWLNILIKVMPVGVPTLVQTMLANTVENTNLLLLLLSGGAQYSILLFLSAGVFHLVFRILVPTRANFSLVLQVLAYSVAPVLLCIVPVAGSLAGFIWGLACSFIGCRYALRLTVQQTITAFIPLCLLLLTCMVFIVKALSTGVAG